MNASSVQRLRQEVSSASTRAEAWDIIRQFHFRALPEEECERLCCELSDLINELPEE
jgi:hypothetical protein